MRVRVHPGGTAQAYTLADSGEDLHQANLRWNGQRMVQMAAFLRGTHQQARDRQNRSFTLTFEVTRSHDSLLDAATFILDHDSEVPTSGLVELTLQDSGAEATRWLPACAISSVNLLFHRGRTTRWSYLLTGGQVLAANPNT